MNNLELEHLEDLRKSGLTDDIIGMMGAYSVDKKNVSQALGWDPKVNSILAFPYPGKDFTRHKVFPPIKDKEGHSIKYLQKKGTGSHLYILPSVEGILKDASVPLTITEGEKKAAALVQHGVMAIGIGGVWNWINGVSHEAISDFDRIAWIDREVSLSLDSDIWYRQDLLKALFALGKELENRGATVRVVKLIGNGQEKIGIDDYLVMKGKEGLSKLSTISLSHNVFSKIAIWWKGWKIKNTIKTEQNSVRDLKSSVQTIRKMPSEMLRSFEKKQNIATVVLAHLLNKGNLYVSPEQNCYYFNSDNGSLDPVESDAFNRFLSDSTGLNPTENEFKYVRESVITETKIRGKKTQVYQLAHYNSKINKLYISDFSGKMLVLDGEKVNYAPNGQDGVLFVSYPTAEVFKYLQPSERINGATLSDFLASVNYDGTSLVSPNAMKHLLFVWVLSLFFPELLPTKIIPVFLGSQGSTKTSTARRFGMQLLGNKFNVGHLEATERGEQAFVAVVCGKPFAAFDNADTPIKWLPDRLATFATGHDFELRELFTTNELSIQKPVAHIVLTSRDPHFRRPDVAERFLLVKLSRPLSFVPESEVLNKLIACRDSVWSDLIDSLNWVLKALREVPESPRMDFRMADYASFGWRISQAMGSEIANSFYASLKNLEKEQGMYTTEEDPLTNCLGFWLQNINNFNREIDTGTLYAELNEIAKREGLILQRTAAVLGKRMRQAKKAIEMSLDIKIADVKTTHTSKWCFSRSDEKSKKFTDNPLPAHPPLNEGGLEVQEGEECEPF